jgi:hypothetical protein
MNSERQASECKSNNSSHEDSPQFAGGIFNGNKLQGAIKWVKWML